MSIEEELKARTKAEEELDNAVHKHFNTDDSTSTKYKKTDDGEDDLMTIRLSRKVMWKGDMNDYAMSLDRLHRSMSPDTQHD